MIDIRDEHGMLILPDLVELPVYRDEFISQQRVDELCKLLWEDGSGLIKYLLCSIDESVPFCRLEYQTMREIGFDLRDINQYLNKKIDKGEIEPLSDLQMCDLLFEVERRVRAVGGYKEFDPVGKPLAPTPQVPFPEHGDILHHIFEGTQEAQFAHDITYAPAIYSPEYMANYKALCEEHPEKLFTYGEEFRRGREYTAASSFVESALNKK